MDINKLSLNINKTKAMMFGYSKTNLEPKLFIEGIQIENVSENIFLGVIIDNKLSWKAHVRHKNKNFQKPLYFKQSQTLSW